MKESTSESNEPFTAGTRELRSSEHDLEVLVGPDKKVFKYHSVILASYSDYIDRMLSSTSIKDEQETMRVSFPDIDTEVWTKAIQFLEPGGYGEMDTPDLNEILPIYHKYAFSSGMDACDDIISRMLEETRTGFSTASEHLIQAAILCYTINLPKSKKGAVMFAADTLLFPSYAEEDIRRLLPLVKDHEPTLNHMISDIMGKSNLSIEEMNTLIQDDSFASNLKVRFEQITEREEILRRLDLKRMKIGCCGSESVNGEYKKIDYSQRCRWKLGAMKSIYVKADRMRARSRIVVEALDPFGNAWQIVYETGETLEELPNPEDRVILYRWENDFSSLSIPCKGWQVVNGELPAPEVRCDFKATY
jgi:hypothetical protein